MPVYLQAFLLASFLHCYCVYALLWKEDDAKDWVVDYNFVSPHFKPLERRIKRGIDEDGDSNTGDTFRLPPDVELQNDTIDHKYYILEIYTNRSDMVKDHYFDVEKVLEKPGAVGNTSHPSLMRSYRRAVAAKIQFEFPFYGYRMGNLTIATGGFSYVGDQSHSWLAATQYIAPLMANFDTHAENSTIMYADDGEKFVIEWKNLQLRGQKTNGYFTFQLSLHKNGDIWFVYKDIPISVLNISDSHHPVKVGMSDAYLFYHKIKLREDQPPTVKRVIYEYHRIEIDPKVIASNTVIRIIAQPTCIQYRTCDDCSNATLAHFNCSWCHSKQSSGGPFCSDSAGLHRRRQQWLDANCKNIGKITYCNAEEDFKEIEEEDVTGATNESASSGASSQVELDQLVPWDKNVNEDSKADAEASARTSSSTSGFIWLLLLLILAALGSCWVVYAYLNPHTPSGQFLIKYRPSQWRMPSSHVRYSASVHM